MAISLSPALPLSSLFPPFSILPCAPGCSMAGEEEVEDDDEEDDEDNEDETPMDAYGLR